MINELALLWISLTSVAGTSVSLSPRCVDAQQEESRELSPRGHYGGYPFLPFLEPLTILAFLSFLAFIVQTFHAIYHTHNHNQNAGLVGGLLNNVLPGRGRSLRFEDSQNENILKAIQLYEGLNKRRKGRKRTRTVL